jgi:hypothetical protein
LTQRCDLRAEKVKKIPDKLEEESDVSWRRLVGFHLEKTFLRAHPTLPDEGRKTRSVAGLQTT